MYYEIAKFARRKGLNAVSIEPGSAKLTSRLSQAFLQLPSGDPRWYRAFYLLVEQRNPFMQSRIQSQKPRMVIVARDHVIYLENKMKPKETIYHTPPTDIFKKSFLRNVTRLLREHRQEKRARRKRIWKTELKGRLKGGKLHRK